MSRQSAVRAASHAVLANGLAVLPFALIPALAALIGHEPVLPPAASILFRVCLFSAGAALLPYAALVRSGWPPKVASLAVALAVGPLAFFPAVRSALLEPESDWTRTLALAYLLASAGLAAIVLVRRPAAKSNLYPLFYILSATMALSPIPPMWRAYGPRPEPDLQGMPGVHQLAAIGRQGPTTLPDVYHLVFDGFGRPDVLQQRFGLDLSMTIRALRDRGFEVAEKDGMANYTQTYLSFASILNAAYLEPVPDALRESRSRVPLYDLIQRSAVIDVFKRLGYEISAIGSSYSATQLLGFADNCDCAPLSFGEFESSVIHVTPFHDLGLAGWDYVPHRNKIRRTFDRLEQLPPPLRPTFLLAHVMAPHPPFVFDADGKAVRPGWVFSLFDAGMYPGTADDYAAGYREQARFIAARLLSVIDHLDAITRASGRDAVIIVHGDHGPRIRFDIDEASKTDASESLPVLLAIRWPNRPVHGSQPVSSLVNIYRELFRRSLDASIEQLPDRAFVSSFRTPYKFLEVAPSSWTPVR